LRDLTDLLSPSYLKIFKDKSLPNIARVQLLERVQQYAGMRT